ncbi:MAG TPA: metallophosphoesterase [Sphingobacteriaceae bacterium]|nr:metallophosphoesterase [Sphingobacteriaceae bacterium]
MDRRKFITGISCISILLADGKVVKATELLVPKSKLKLRFFVASDGHYGQPDIPSDEYFKTLVESVNSWNKTDKAKFIAINGDIIHDKKEFLLPAKQWLEKLDIPYYVTKGNHDTVEDDYWNKTFNTSLNYSFKKGSDAFVFANTSNLKGEYVCPDVKWMEAELNKYKGYNNIFIFIHITPIKWTAHGIDWPQLIELFTHYPNIRAVFNGHDHQQDDIKVKNNISYLFDGHFGGSWGVPYRGFRMVEIYTDNTIQTCLFDPTAKLKKDKIV